MGTQQLLLIVLGVIIVGIAVVVGITIFGSNADQANKDAVTQDCLRIAAGAQGFYAKPSMLGGGGNTFTGITVADCGMKPDSNANAKYSFSAVSATSCTVKGVSNTVFKTGTTKSFLTITVTASGVGNPDYTNW